MTNITIILAVIGGYHSSQIQCQKVTRALSDLAVVEAFQGDGDNSVNIDEELEQIRKFYVNCEKKK